MSAAPAVIIASDEPSLLDELVRFLDQVPHWHLLASARSSGELLQLIEADTPDAILVSDGLARDMAVLSNGLGDKTRIVVVGRREHPDTLRAALNLRARGFALWPNEIAQIKDLVERGLDVSRGERKSSGSMTIFWSPKAGSGSTVLSAHLASALHKLSVDVLLVDLDLNHGDLASVLGAEDESKSIMDLLRVVDEIGPSSIESVVHRHASGFRTILARSSFGGADLVKPDDVRRVLMALRETCSHLLVDTPGGFGELPILLSEDADRVVLVLTPNVLSLRRGREAAAMLRSSGIGEDKISGLLNRFSRASEIGPSDAQAATGVRFGFAVGDDFELAKAADRGVPSESAVRRLLDVARGMAGLPVPRTSGLRQLVRRRG